MNQDVTTIPTLDTYALIQEHAHVLPIVILFAVCVVLLVKGHMPDGIKMRALFLAVGEVIASLIMIMWLVAHKNSDLGSMAMFLSLAVSVWVYDSFRALKAAIGDMRKQTTPTAPASHDGNPK